MLPCLTRHGVGRHVPGFPPSVPPPFYSPPQSRCPDFTPFSIRCINLLALLVFLSGVGCVGNAKTKWLLPCTGVCKEDLLRLCFPELSLAVPTSAEGGDGREQSWGGGLLCDLGVTAAFCLFLCLCAQRWVGETSIFFPKGGLEIVLCHQADSKSLQVYCEAGFSVPLSLFSRWEMAQAMGFRVYFCLFLLCFGRTTSISLGMRWFRCSEMAEDGQGFSSCLFWDWE